jgi:hypothetical protein
MRKFLYYIIFYSFPSFYFKYQNLTKICLLNADLICFQSKINRLPGYLAIQFVRFYYKEKESINAKILKVKEVNIRDEIHVFCEKFQWLDISYFRNVWF